MSFVITVHVYRLTCTYINITGNETLLIRYCTVQNKQLLRQYIFNSCPKITFKGTVKFRFLTHIYS